MTTVYLKYDPIAMVSEIGLNGYLVQEPNILCNYISIQLINWVGNIVPILKEATGDNQFSIDFYGTVSDYNDLANSINQYLTESNDVSITVNFYQLDFANTTVPTDTAVPTNTPGDDPALRMYKGIMFESVEQKEAIEQKENEIVEFCQEIENKEFEELWQAKEQLMSYPPAIFSGYYNQILAEMQKKEEAEKNAIVEEIDKYDMEKLIETKMDVDQKHYSYGIKDIILKEIHKKIRQCQREDLENTIRSMDISTREMLRDLLTEIKEKQYDDDITQEYLLRVNRQIDLIETKELEELCNGIDEKDIDQLNELMKVIQDKQYQEKFTMQYTSKIMQRLENLHVQCMEEYCKDVAEADREQVNTIRERLINEECRPELKNRFFAQVNERQDKLDYDELSELTEDIEDKTLAELEELFNKLTTGNYNPKYASTFMLKVRKPMEHEKYKRAQYIIRNLDTMNKEALLSAQRELEECHYPERIALIIKEQLDEKQFQLDMQELIGKCNDFDQMSLEEIQNLRNEFSAMSVLPRSVATYETKLRERELAIGQEKVSQHAAYVKQSVDQMGLFALNVHMAIYSVEYQADLLQFERTIGKLDYEDLPIFIMPDVGFLAVTKTGMFCSTPNGYIKIPYGDFRSFLVEKKFISEVISIALQNGMTIPIQSSVKKNLESVANFVTYVIQNVNNEAVYGRFTPYCNPVSPFEEDKLPLRDLPKEVTEQTISRILMDQFTGMERAVGAISCIKHVFSQNWTTLETKLRTNFGIYTETQIHMYYDTSKFGGPKDGFAVGTKMFHMKRNGQNLVSIPYKDIFEIKNMPGQIQVITNLNNVLIADCTFPNDEIKHQFVLILNAYVKGIQLVNAVSPETEQLPAPQPMGMYGMPNGGAPMGGMTPQQQPPMGGMAPQQQPPMAEAAMDSGMTPPPQTMSPKWCTGCGNQLNPGAAFCNKCGKPTS